MVEHKGTLLSLCRKCVAEVDQFPGWVLTPVDAADNVCERCGGVITAGTSHLPISYTMMMAAKGLDSHGNPLHLAKAVNS